MELVGPISSLQPLIAPGLDSLSAQSGPLVMKSTRVGKNGFPCATEAVQVSFSRPYAHLKSQEVQIEAR